MKTLDWNASHYLINGKPGFMVSGEIHYFRVPKTEWERRLKLFQDAGGNTVATYVPWILHERSEGDVRFGDESYRDLEGFLTLCKKLGLFVVVRPGPYQYSEMLFDGLPGWLCQDYPEILARDVKGDVFRKSSVSYLHPLFLEKVRIWYRRVCPLIAKHTLSRGGAVAFVQFDNELMGVHDWFGSWDYHPVTMGFGQEGGRFPRFLEQRYSGIETLNDSWGAELSGFLEARPLVGKPTTTGERRRTKDYQDFYFGTVAEYAEILVEWMREDGIDSDIVHNSANPYMNSYFLELTDRLQAKGIRFILGSDHYYNLGQDWDQNNPTPKYAAKCFYSNEMLRLMGMPATIFELPGGSPSDWPPVAPEDLLCSYMLNIALGMKGSNYYIFTGGPNPENIGCFDDIYDFQASVAANGALRPTYQSLKTFGTFLQENAWLAEADQVADFQLGLVWEYSRSKAYFDQCSDLGFSGEETWTFFQKGVMMSALCASHSPSLVQVDRETNPIPTNKPLFVALSVALSEHGQRRLVDFVERGGRLIIAPVVPSFDENLEPCTILADFLGSPTFAKNRAGFARLNVGPVKNVLINGDLFLTEVLPEGAVAFAEDEHSGQIGGWRMKRGQGEVLWLGLSWKHAMLTHSTMITWLLHEAGASNKAVDCDNPCVWTTLRSTGERAMLFAMNLFSSPMNVTISVGSHGFVLPAQSVRLAPMEVRTFEISAP